MKSLFVILLLLLCVNSFDYLLFVELWPGSWIHENKLKYNFTNNFDSIHGIWPQYENSSYPQFCNNKTQFDISKLSHILPNLTMYWTNFVNATDLWQHEFHKHMTCATSSYPDPYTLFYVGLDLREKYNVYQLLANHDIVPDNNIRYDINKLYYLIKKAYNVDVVITCEPDTILNEIRFCMDKDFNLFDCPKNLYKEQCKSSAIWYNKIIY